MNCTHCGESTEIPYRCSYCNSIYCTDHRLPEGHDCDSAKEILPPDKSLEDEVDVDIESPKPLDPSEIDTYTKKEPDWSEGKSPPVIMKTDEPDEGEPEEDRGFVARILSLFS